MTEDSHGHGVMSMFFPPWNPDIEIRRQLKIAHRCGQMMSPSHLSQHDDFLMLD